ncbi:uncharacterized protein LOC128984547 [Macrosteles quadrilineatus]|uniref:uncharacterized protein LOC128984547 n=1 Tax=Macrosteles quadrilineatus TaxID=74068 RepID=UPI0023E162AC|nr:uncharacterized protein LOC128984547 [Macrosteles quadrilineatus]
MSSSEDEDCAGKPKRPKTDFFKNQEPLRDRSDKSDDEDFAVGLNILPDIDRFESPIEPGNNNNFNISTPTTQKSLPVHSPVTPQPLQRPTSHILDDQAWKKSVTKTLAVLKVNQNIIKELLESLITKQSSTGNRTVTENDEDMDLSAILGNFPLETSQDLEDVEEKLKEKVIFDLMVKHFSIVGGENTKEAVKRLLRRMFSDELAKNYSYLGFKKKRVFADLRLKSVLFGTNGAILLQKPINLKTQPKNSC